MARHHRDRIREAFDVGDCNDELAGRLARDARARLAVDEREGAQPDQLGLNGWSSRIRH